MPRGVIQFRVDGGHSAGPSTEEPAKVKALKVGSVGFRKTTRTRSPRRSSSPGSPTAQPLVRGFIDIMKAEDRAVESI